ncbi:hypothetical protein [Gottfriedia solisilvae]|uniref:Uncharacterized protein n=1 Tax=Gottfriedia solisilvae TaxID=1516104 RepID=A0A8J3F0S0_9BACI|nr:hypothetical protein [Gottfriedia solisilvae]GGI15811.1 hypothetical protein GCM10007380_29890 [Gottfriedia solisilvae]
MKKIYLVFAERYKEEEIIYVGTDKNSAINYYYACHEVDLDINSDIILSIKYSDSWIQIWEDGKLIEKVWRPNIKGME